MLVSFLHQGDYYQLVWQRVDIPMLRARRPCRASEPVEGLGCPIEKWTEHAVRAQSGSLNQQMLTFFCGQNDPVDHVNHTVTAVNVLHFKRRIVYQQGRIDGLAV